MLTESVETFLTHPFPAIRVKTAEHLYAVLSSSISFEDEAKQAEHQAGKLHVWENLEAVLLDTKWGASTRVDTETVRVITTALPRLLA